MKLKAPEGVGDPCVAGVVLAPCDGCYEVAPEVGVHLIECFGFVLVVDDAMVAPPPSKPRRSRAATRKGVSLPDSRANKA